ncbi:MerR family transcriptional regulator [Actinomadura chibensis]|uniref:MerR family transcriptional regulator n=1 Tax=Actinomadura chibensis TaxID=392828 RepID=UPI000833DDAD|nr:MerR family transcriptional regulator [Actinomadura chibensis]
MDGRTIGDVAAEIGVSPQTLRVWEKQELLVPHRTEGGQRRYGPAHVRRARRIADLRQRHGWNPAAIKTSLEGEGDGDDGNGGANGNGNGTGNGGGEPERERHADGERLRRARRARGLSLVNLAALAGTSPSHLSSIERGLDRPSTQLVARLTDALGVPMSGLADFKQLDPTVMRLGDRTQVQLENGATWEELAYPGHDLEAAMLTVSPGGSSGGPYARPGETFAHVLEGAIRFQLGGGLADHHEVGAVEHVGTGDSITVPARTYLSWSNEGSAPARALWVEVLPSRAWADPVTRRIVKAASGVAPGSD